MQKENHIHKAKKSLGQNFLKSDIVLRKIVEVGEIKTDETILEIGPGKGALTEKLLASGCQLIAIEKDRELFEFLNQKFEKEILNKKLILVEGDILDFDINTYKLKADTYKLIANIPYNITGAILKKFLTAEHQPKSMILMIQHEVATRILARDGKESILSISVKAYGEPKMIMKVDKRYFSPAPKVNSAVIKISNISRKTFVENKINEENFWEIVKNGFAHKRKKLSSNLKEVENLSKDTRDGLGNKRAEDLSISDWILLAKS